MSSVLRNVKTTLEALLPTGLGPCSNMSRVQVADISAVTA